MAQRLTLKTEFLMDVVKTFDTMYTPDKLYDYANFITIYAEEGLIFFEMCVILDGASNDAMVRLNENVGDGLNLPPIILNFVDFKNAIKNAKGDDIILDISEKTVKIHNTKMEHTLVASTVAIPSQIVNVLEGISSTSRAKLVDFNLAKLYNNMNDVGANLTSNTLRTELYGIMCTPEYMVATDGLSMTYQFGKFLPEPFMFPKHSLRILKMLPKLMTKYVIVDHRIYFEGVGFQCYIGEWGGYKTFPVNGIGKLIESADIKIPDGVGLFEAIKQCHKFGELAVIKFNQGTVSNKKGTHIERFEPFADMGDRVMYVLRGVMLNATEATELYVSGTKSLGRVVFGNRSHIFLGATGDVEESES